MFWIIICNSKDFTGSKLLRRREIVARKSACEIACPMRQSGYRPTRNSSGELTLSVTLRGEAVVHDPMLNKSIAFTNEEREALELEGIFPHHVATLEEQIARTRENYDLKPDNLEKYIFLRSLQDRNETLYYALIKNFIEEMLPIIYTPTVGQAVERFGHNFRQMRGLFITPENIHRMDQMVRNQPSSQIDLIVVTDSEAILGIGDQGVGGMAIPIGKLSIYTLAAGFHPAGTLPILLDVGTDNAELLEDPLYPGLRQRRLRGEAYSKFVQQFVDGVKRNYPNAVLQWEDFSRQNAFTLLHAHRQSVPSFNDDIQGTAAMTVAGLYNAMRIKKEPLRAQRFCISGAGAAGIGIAHHILQALMEEGLSREEALKQIFVVDSRGLLLESRSDIGEYKKPFARKKMAIAFWELADVSRITLKDVVANAKITVLIGVSGMKDAFTDEIIKIMLKNSPRPVIFPLSNPHSHSERDPGEILKLTDGAALVASGSPYPAIEIRGKRHEISQGNNALLFPGIGLGALAGGCSEIPDSFFASAATALSQSVSDYRLESGALYPSLQELQAVSLSIAFAVYRKACDEGLAIERPGVRSMESLEEFKQWHEDWGWKSEYVRYVAE